MAKSSIEWTDYSFNPWWGCVKVSPGCEHCYAETLSKRWGNDIWGPAANTSRRLFGDKHWQEPIRWNHAARNIPLPLPYHDGRKVFCASMCDVFEDHPDVEVERCKLWNLIESTPDLIWQLLTKRPENILKFAPWKNGFPKNVWVGISIENNKAVLDRMGQFLTIPIIPGKRFLSCEPLLEETDIEVHHLFQGSSMEYLDWVIVGGESGPKKRPFNPDWARKIRDKCAEFNVPFFMKQMDKVQPIPEDLLIRQFPTA